MPASEPTSAGLTPERIAHVRELRRAAIRRRQIIVVSLLVITVAVFALAFLLHFSPLFALIPFVVLLAVLGLGMNASRQARAWEQRATAYERTRREHMKNHPAVTSKQAAHSGDAQDSASDVVVDSAVEDDAKTEVLEQRQIRRALREAELEQQSALAQRAAVQAKVTDATSELASITPSHALDAFEMASSQDLISFSLGSADDVVTMEPQSLEIKSMRQVAQAMPVDTSEAKRLSDEARLVAAADQAASFHESEEHAEVEAPDASSDSLGVGLDSILSRRA